MSFVIVEFSEASGGGVAIVHSVWITPCKKIVFWHPIKQQSNFDKALKAGATPENSWEIFQFFYETGKFTEQLLIFHIIFCLFLMIMKLIYVFL